MTNEKLKQESIKNAYGEYWEQCKIDENGWCDYDDWLNFIGQSIYYDLFDWKMRPKSLFGIDNNNGWIRIEEDGSNLPKQSGEYWF